MPLSKRRTESSYMSVYVCNRPMNTVMTTGVAIISKPLSCCGSQLLAQTLAKHLSSLFLSERPTTLDDFTLGTH